MATGAQYSPVEALEDQAGVIPLGLVLDGPVSLRGLSLGHNGQNWTAQD